MSEDSRRLTLRLPPQLHEELSAQAEREQRSLNGQIVYLLGRAAVNGNGDEPTELDDHQTLRGLG